MTEADRIFVARLCAERGGLAVEADKVYLLESRLGPVARREGFGSISELIHAVRDRDEARLAWAVIEAMLLPEGVFFRDPHLFAMLRDQLLPKLARRREGEAIRVWNAACGSGQEIYSLAMMLADAPIAGTRIELFASDLGERHLEKAQSGVYSQFEVQRGLPSRLLVRHFEKQDDTFVVSPQLRQMVRWRRVNLLEDLSRLGQFDVVLCRGLLPAMTASGRGRALTGLAGALAEGGALIVDSQTRVELPGFVPVSGLDGAYAFAAETRVAA